MNLKKQLIKLAKSDPEVEGPVRNLLHRMGSVLSDLQRLNDKEKMVLRAALTSAANAGYDMGFVDEMPRTGLSKHQVAGYLGSLQQKGLLECYGRCMANGKFVGNEFALSRELLVAVRKDEEAIYDLLGDGAGNSGDSESGGDKPQIVNREQIGEGWQAIQTEKALENSLWYIYKNEKRMGYIKHLGGRNWQIFDAKKRRVITYRRRGDAFRYAPGLLE